MVTSEGYIFAVCETSDSTQKRFQLKGQANLRYTNSPKFMFSDLKSKVAVSDSVGSGTALSRRRLKRAALRFKAIC